jgi:ribosomal protein L11 methylase PrmA
VASRFQLRRYTIRPGEMQDWLREWQERVRPLRARFGFQVVGSWTADADQFVWIIRYDGPLTWEEADRAYYASPERKALSPDPARHLAASDTLVMDATP